MVVLESSPPLPAVGLYNLEEPNSGKMINKRFINLHSWLGPVRVKQIKESMVGKFDSCGEYLGMIFPVRRDGIDSRRSE